MNFILGYTLRGRGTRFHSQVWWSTYNSVSHGTSVNTQFTSCQVPPFLIHLPKVSSFESAIVLLVMASQCLKMHFTIMIQVMKVELQ